MDLTPHLDALRRDLEAVAGSEESVGPVVDRLVRAMQPAFHVRMLEILGEATLELTEQLPDGRVGVQLAGRDIVFTVTDVSARPDPRVHDDDTTARLTLRMPERLKAFVEQAAIDEGVSTNSWLVGAVRSALGQRTGRRGPGRRLTGYAEA